MICVTGSFGGGDIGDDAMVFPHLDTLKCLGVADKDIILIGFDPVYMSQHFSFPLSQCLPSDPFDLPAGLMKEADLLLVTGGGTINTRAQDGYSLRRMYKLVMPFARAGVPVFMSGQTIGPLGVDPSHDALAKEIIESVDILTVRDMTYSREYIEKIGAEPKEFHETVDDATMVAPAPSLPIALPEGKKVAINVTVYTYDTPEKREAIRTICYRFSCMGYSVLLVPHHPWDLEAMKSITVPNTTLIDTTNWHGVTTKKLFSECSLVIAGRYHAVVFAMTGIVPCVGMAGNHYSWIKQHGFADQLGLGDRIVPPGGVTDAEGVVELARKVMKSDQPYIIPEPSSFHLFQQWFKEKTCSS